MPSDDRIQIIDAKAGEWVDGVLWRDTRVIVPRRDPETGLAQIGPHECCELVVAELDRRLANYGISDAQRRKTGRDLALKPCTRTLTGRKRTTDVRSLAIVDKDGNVLHHGVRIKVESITGQTVRLSIEADPASKRLSIEADPASKRHG